MCVTVCAVQKTHTCPVSNSTTPTETSQLGCRRRSRVWSSDFGGGSSDSRPNHAAALPALRSTRASPSPVWSLQHFIFKHMHGDFHPTGSPLPTPHRTLICASAPPVGVVCCKPDTASTCSLRSRRFCPPPPPSATHICVYLEGIEADICFCVLAIVLGTRHVCVCVVCVFFCS